MDFTLPTLKKEEDKIIWQEEVETKNFKEVKYQKK